MTKKLALSLLLLTAYHQQAVCQFNIPSMKNSSLVAGAGALAYFGDKKINQHFNLSTKYTELTAAIAAGSLTLSKLSDKSLQWNNPLTKIGCAAAAATVGLTAYSVLNRKKTMTANAKPSTPTQPDTSKAEATPPFDHRYS